MYMVLILRKVPPATAPDTIQIGRIPGQQRPTNNFGEPNSQGGIVKIVQILFETQSVQKVYSVSKKKACPFSLYFISHKNIVSINDKKSTQKKNCKI